MTTADLPAVLELDQQSFALPWPVSAFKYEVESNPLSRCRVAEIENDAAEPLLVGMIVIWLIMDEAHVATIAVNPGYRRQKIAQRLLAYALVDAHDAGMAKSLLEVRRGNTAAIAMYHRFGYRESGIRKKYYKDNSEDAVLMDLDPIVLDNLVALQ